MTYIDLAACLGVSEQFIKNVHSSQVNSHYNVFHLWKISNYLGISISDLFPSSFKLYKRIYPLKDYNSFIKLKEGTK
ncbi:helix-turn-helix transcriptional regulator [Lactobacillus sp. DCY120]|uniref:Helix-turn-helix transcriptional regulator n=2 Tax=Bombilactobacillus apium TaxID=2675299 RepID=A0A850R9U2_9LACO|nr:helix-turn-helix transcriptional regulator [Bombilactobacillus apium]